MDGSVLNWMRDLAGYQLFFYFIFILYFFLGPQMHCLSIHSELCPMFWAEEDWQESHVLDLHHGMLKVLMVL